MRVVVPYTNLRPQTKEALDKYSPIEAEYFDVSESDESYFDMLSDVWRDGEGFILIEHDIEVGPTTIDELLSCEEEWCAFPYAMGGGNDTTALGCTKFGQGLVSALPYFPEWLSMKGDPWAPARHWARLDTRTFAILTDSDYTEHRHEPSVKHHNPEKAWPPSD